jgi:hypothetical protein
MGTCLSTIQNWKSDECEAHELTDEHFEYIFLTVVEAGRIPEVVSSVEPDGDWTKISNTASVKTDTELPCSE